MLMNECELVDHFNLVSQDNTLGFSEPISPFCLLDESKLQKVGMVTNLFNLTTLVYSLHPPPILSLTEATGELKFSDAASKSVNTYW